MDNTSDLVKQITRTAVILVVIYLMIIGVVRVRNESIINSAIVVIDDAGVFGINHIVYDIQLDEGYDFELNITIEYNKLDNQSQVHFQFYKWNDTQYDSWVEAEYAWMEIGDSPIEVIPQRKPVHITDHATIMTITLTEGSWVLQLIPSYNNPYSITLTEIP